MNFKKLTFTFSLLLFTIMLSAQDANPMRPYLLGGNFSFLIQKNAYPPGLITVPSAGIYSYNNNEISNYSFSFSPYLGKRINRHWISGLQLRYGINRYETPSILVFGQTDPVDFERTSNQISVGLFSRYTIYPDKILNVFIQPSIHFNWNKEVQKQDGSISDEKTANTFNLGARFGICYNINERWNGILQFGSIQYLNGKWEDKDSDNGNNYNAFETNFSLSSVRLGIEMKF